jgi:hypothetical protein
MTMPPVGAPSSLGWTAHLSKQSLSPARRAVFHHFTLEKRTAARRVTGGYCLGAVNNLAVYANLFTAPYAVIGIDGHVIFTPAERYSLAKWR